LTEYGVIFFIIQYLQATYQVFFDEENIVYVYTYVCKVLGFANETTAKISNYLLILYLMLTVASRHVVRFCTTLDIRTLIPLVAFCV